MKIKFEIQIPDPIINVTRISDDEESLYKAYITELDSDKYYELGGSSQEAVNRFKPIKKEYLIQIIQKIKNDPELQEILKKLEEYLMNKEY